MARHAELESMREEAEAAMVGGAVDAPAIGGPAQQGATLTLVVEDSDGLAENGTELSFPAAEVREKTETTFLETKTDHLP